MLNKPNGLPPHGGSGLKLYDFAIETDYNRSPSTRREWIEIGLIPAPSDLQISLPPHGGSGLK